MDPGGGPVNREEATIEVPTKGGGPPEESKEPQLPVGPNPELVGDAHEGMSAEDKALKERLELAVERSKDENPDIQKMALELLRKEIRESTSSMTAVPKPLKFLSPFFEPLKTYYSSLPSAQPNKRLFSDILSVLAMTMGAEGARESLKFKLAGNREDVGDWGHEYVRSLAGEVGAEWNARLEVDGQEEGLPESALEDLLNLVKLIVPFNMTHNAEAEAVDLLLEVGRLDLLTSSDGMLIGSNSTSSTTSSSSNAVSMDVVGAGGGGGSSSSSTAAAAAAAATALDASICARVCMYLLKCADYVGDHDEEVACMETAYALYLVNKAYTDALRVALRLGGVAIEDKIRQVFDACDDMSVRRQLAYILGRQRVNYVVGDDTLDNLIGNSTLSELYNALGRDLDVLEPKTPEDIYKSHLAGDSRTNAAAGGAERIDSARANLASTFVNAFVNAGYGTDKLMSPQDSTWVFKNKDHGQVSAAASLGLLHIWNDNQLSTLDRLMEAPEDNLKAGALLGIGLCCTGTRNLDANPAYALLSDHLAVDGSSTHAARVSAAMGLGLAYAGSKREEVADLLIPFVTDTSATASMELACVAAVSIGFIYIASGSDIHAAVIVERLMSCNDAEAGQALARHMALGLGLLFLGRETEAEPMLEVVNTIESAIGRTAHVILQSCAFAATGNVLQIQRLMRMCAEHPEMEDKEKEEKAAVEKAEKDARDRAAAAPPGGMSNAANAATIGAGSGGAGATASATTKEKDAHGKYMHQSAAVLGLALVAMGEELSVSLAGRMADHMLAYGDTAVRRVVPLALALCHISDPQYEIVDVLSKLSHDPNEDTAQSAIFSMGVVGAGTNNSRIAGLLRTLATFYRNEASHLFIVRLAQGLLHMGKGLITINPFHSDRALLSPVALGGILATMFCGLDFKATLHAKHTNFLYFLATAMQPRFVCTVDETGKPVPVEVRVGQAVETVGQAGRPKTITGFQTHTTPVLMGVHERTEIADESFTPLTSVIEGVVVVRVNQAVRARKLAEKEAREREKKAVKAVGTRSDLTWG